MKKARNGRYAPPSARRDQVTGPRPHIRRSHSFSCAPGASPLRVKTADESDTLPRDRVTPTIRAGVFDAATAFRTRMVQPAHGETARKAHLLLPRSRGKRAPSSFARLFSPTAGVDSLCRTADGHACFSEIAPSPRRAGGRCRPDSTARCRTSSVRLSPKAPSLWATLRQRIQAAVLLLYDCKTCDFIRT